MGEYLKDKYIGKLSSFIVLNIFIYVLVVSGLMKGNEVSALELSSLAWRFVIPAVAIVFALLLSGVLTSQMKARIVFCRWNNPLPGTRAFTEIAPNDARVELERLKKELGSLPTDPNTQNRLWYDLLKQREEETMIKSSHRYFLFARDVASIGLMFLIVLSPTLLISSGGFYVEAVYVAFLIVQYIISKMAARNYGRRLVGNVLAGVSYEGAQS